MKLLFLVESSFNMTDIQGQEASKVWVRDMSEVKWNQFIL